MKRIYLLGLLALVVLAGAFSLVQAATTMSLNVSDSISGTAPIQLGRIFRDAIPSACPSKAYPGIFNAATSYGYDVHGPYGPMVSDTCITINFDPNTGPGAVCGTNAHASAYLNSYDPANQAANYVGDVGSSITQPFSFTVPAGQSFVVVVTNTANAADCGYSFTSTPFDVTGGPIAVLPFGGDVFEPGDNRLNRSSKDRSAPVAVYCTADEIMVLKVDPTTARAIDHASIVISQEDVEAAGVPETANLLLAEGDGVQLWRLVGGRFQVNAFYPNQPEKPWVFNWEDCNVFSGVHMAN
jgi:hypothetical protein